MRVSAVVNCSWILTRICCAFQTKLTFFRSCVYEMSRGLPHQYIGTLGIRNSKITLLADTRLFAATVRRLNSPVQKGYHRHVPSKSNFGCEHTAAGCHRLPESCHMPSPGAIH